MAPSCLFVRSDTRNANACAANDFALVRVDAPDRRRVNPTVPFWGGPTGLGRRAPARSAVYSWGQSSLRPTTLLSPKTGLSLGPTHGGWGVLWENLFNAGVGVVAGAVILAVVTTVQRLRGKRHAA